MQAQDLLGSQNGQGPSGNLDIVPSEKKAGGIVQCLPSMHKILSRLYPVLGGGKQPRHPMHNQPNPCLVHTAATTTMPPYAQPTQPLPCPYCSHLVLLFLVMCVPSVWAWYFFCEAAPKENPVLAKANKKPRERLRTMVLSIRRWQGRWFCGRVKKQTPLS